MFGHPILVQVSVHDLARLYGPVGGMTPDQILQANRAEVDQAAKRKVQGMAHRPAEPLTLGFEDFLI